MNGSRMGASEAWLYRLALKFTRPRSFEILTDGRARLTIDYPSLGDLMTLLQDIDALVAMVEEDAHAERGGPG